MNNKISVWILYFSILTFIPSMLMAQQDSLNIQKKILSSEESDQMFIQRTRNYILNCLKSGDIKDAKEAYNYVINKYDNEHIIPFWANEKFFLGFWFGNYNIIYAADSIENSLDIEAKKQWNPAQGNLYPQNDLLTQEIKIITWQNRTELLHNLDSLVTDNEKHNYLVLFFDWLTFTASNPRMTEQEVQEYLEKSLTPRAKDFIDTYKDSLFRSFVLRHFHFIYKLNNWGFGYYFGLGSLTPQGTSAQYLNAEGTLGIGFDVSWKNILTTLGFDIGIPVAARKPFVYQGESWDTDLRNNHIPYFLSIGYVVEETQFLKVSPYVGIGGINISVCEGDNNKPGGDNSMTQSVLQYGINFDIKLSTNNSFNKQNNNSYLGLKFDLDYLKFLGNNPIMSGGMLQFRVSFIGFARTIIREI